jgi:hypothetical protein
VRQNNVHKKAENSQSASNTGTKARKDYQAAQGADDITCARLIRQAGPIPESSHRAEDRDGAIAVGAGRADGLRGARAVVCAAAGRVVSSAHEQRVECAAGAVVLHVTALQVCGARMRVSIYIATDNVTGSDTRQWNRPYSTTFSGNTHNITILHESYAHL